MCAVVNTLVVLGGAFAALAALAASADPLASQAVEEARWAPALALTSGIQFQRHEARVESFIQPTGVPIRPADSGSDWDVFPYIGANLELMTPVIPRIPGRPRVFVVGEALPSFTASRQTATEGRVEPFGFPANRPDPSDYPASLITGVGSETVSQTRRYVWAAGIGVAFPFEVRGRQLWLKPSFGWLRYEVGVVGRLHAAFKDDPEPRPQQAPYYGYNTRLIELEARESMVLHGIGPGLELEMELGRRGPLRPTLFFDAHAYRLLGDRGVAFSDSVDLTPADDNYPATETYVANWSFDLDPWIYRAGVGLRFRWLGK